MLSVAHEAALDRSDLFTVSVHGGDIQDLIQEGTKLHWLQVTHPKKMSWKVCARSEHVSLCIAMYEQEIDQKSGDAKLSKIEDKKKTHDSTIVLSCSNIADTD